MIPLEKITLTDFPLENGKIQPKITLSFQQFGLPLGSAPVVLVNHALTGNSDVAGEKGWWKSVIGIGKTIDTDLCTVLAFNIPGNGFQDPENTLADYKDFTAKDIAKLFWFGLDCLQVPELFAIIGGSLGGGIAWEMAALEPQRIQNLIPVATDWKATDWVIANVLVQDRILNNSDDPIADARLHAMLLYRTPQSLQLKFNRNQLANSNVYQIENWLIGHGFKLQRRFRLASYKLMNHLLKTINIAKTDDFIAVAERIQANIHIIGVDTDYFFSANENRKTVALLRPFKPNVFYYEIESIHGHDAFLIESEQLSQILEPIFQPLKTNALCLH